MVIILSQDGSGEITKSEFVEFMDKLSQEISVWPSKFSSTVFPVSESVLVTAF